MPDYQTRKFAGEEKETLLVHLVFGERVEVYTRDWTVLTRAEFEKMVTWISAEFDRLAEHVATVH